MLSWAKAATGNVRSMSTTSPMPGLASLPLLRSLARSLWGETELRGAALMIGAGFSRNADLPAHDSRGPPLWRDLEAEMRAELGPEIVSAQSAPALAAQYEETFGRPRLEGLIRRLVPDGSWQPGDLHRRLLGLPWTEVLTTNYDTLLERAAEQIVEPIYETVLTPTDLARTRSPRVVKLHGSLPSHTPFIITDSDYRTYADNFGPFVNLARHVLLENDVCMLGFSGDDPNFRNWVDWVQAEIGQYGRTIFLVGVFDADDRMRSFYDGRGVRLLDLGPFVPTETGDIDERNAAAARLFLETIESMRPLPVDAWPSRTPWPPSAIPPIDPTDPHAPWLDFSDATFCLNYLETCASRWRDERASYPGWCEPPPLVRRQVELNLPDHVAAVLSDAASGQDDRHAMLGDVLWRLDLVHGDIAPHDLARIETMLAALDLTRLRRQDRAPVGRLMLRTYREAKNRQGFERWISRLSAIHTSDRNLSALVAYESALWARDHVDFESIEGHLTHIAGADPIWGLRRASLLAELGRHDEFAETIFETLSRLKGLVARDRTSLSLRSRFAWAAFLANALVQGTPGAPLRAEVIEERLDRDDWYRRFEIGLCNPWDRLEALDDAIVKAERDRRRELRDRGPHFDAGMFRAAPTRWTRAPVASIERFAARFADHVGLPASLGGFVNVMESRFASALEATADTSGPDPSALLLCISRGEAALLDRSFDRISVARFERSVIDDLTSRTRRAIEHALAARPADMFWRNRLEALVGLLSRLCIRMSPSDASSCLRLAADLTSDPIWGRAGLGRVVGLLLSRSMEALPPSSRSPHIPALIAFPLPSDLGLPPTPGWPDTGSLIRTDDIRPDDDGTWGVAISRMLALSRDGSSFEASLAILRLLALARGNLLRDSELAALDEAFQSRRRRAEGPDYHGNIAVMALLDVPSNDEAERRSVVRRLVLSSVHDFGQPFDPVRGLLCRMATMPSLDIRTVLGSDDRLQVLDGLVRWRPREEDRSTDLLGLAFEEVRTSREIASALAGTVLPAMTAETMGEERLGAIRQLLTDPRLPDHLTLVPQAIRLGIVDIDAGTTKLRGGLLSRCDRRISAALTTLVGWSRAPNDPAIGPLPATLVDDVVAHVALRVQTALPQALQAVALVASAGTLSPTQIERVSFALHELLEETNYGDWRGTDEESARLTLVRASCVTLSRVLVELGVSSAAADRWIAVQEGDELPEIRNAPMVVIGGA